MASSSSFSGQFTPDDKFEQGMNLLQEAFREKMKSLLDENTQLKYAFQSQKQQVQKYEEENISNRNRIKELESILQQQTEENRRLSTQRKEMVDQINLLQSNNLQLEQFRKSIVSMVERDNNGNEVGGKSFLNNNNFGSHSAPLQGRSNGMSSSIPFSNGGNQNRNNLSNGINSTDYSDSRMNFSKSTPKTMNRRGFHTEDGENDVMRFQLNDLEGMNLNKEPQVKPIVAQKAPELYKQIKASIGPQKFLLFAAEVNKMNEGQDPDVTLNNIHQLITDPILFHKMEDLIQSTLI
eukprot:TRINITY_DN5664_c0_g1_i1.p1 TRINITY_DN5664_c0_g1~~TRINITY_DN5664_c0_g1_i1.p1  ORF type:complete len:294 (-),score=101.17 TRINITY_DN5664_c0_g1_i1:174-1055(-)